MSENNVVSEDHDMNHATNQQQQDEKDIAENKSMKWHDRLRDAVRILDGEEYNEPLSGRCLDVLEAMSDDADCWGTCACGEREEILQLKRDNIEGPWDDVLEDLGIAFMNAATSLNYLEVDNPKQKALDALHKMRELQEKIQKRAIVLLTALATGNVLEVDGIDKDNVPHEILKGEYDKNEIRTKLGL